MPAFWPACMSDGLSPIMNDFFGSMLWSFRALVIRPGAGFRQGQFSFGWWGQ